jgi:cysteinyl-tRNA synthetase
VLNIFNKTPDEWYRALMKVKKIDLSEEDLLDKITQREEARKNRDWDTADDIRNELAEMNIVLEDKKDGTAWKIKVG